MASHDRSGHERWLVVVALGVPDRVRRSVNLGGVDAVTTDRERAYDTVDLHYNDNEHYLMFDERTLVSAIEAAIREARRMELARCAEVVEGKYPHRTHGDEKCAEYGCGGGTHTEECRSHWWTPARAIRALDDDAEDDDDG